MAVWEVGRLVGSAPVGACRLGPVPAWLVGGMRGLLSPFVALLFGASLVSGCFPSEFRRAVVRPLLGKGGLDAGELESFRPVSNLAFLSVTKAG